MREMTQEEIKEYLTNRYDLLLVDFVTNIEPGILAEGYLDCPEDAWFFVGHHPNNPVMPASIQIEALSQMFNLSFLTAAGKNITPLLRKVSNAIFYSKVLPGSRFYMKAKLVSHRRGIAEGICEGFVNGELVSKAEFTQVTPNITCYIPSREE